MKKEEAIGFALTAVVIFVVVLIVTNALIDYFANEQEAKQKCFEHNYLDMEWANGKRYCIGTKDGSTIVVPLESLE